MPKKALPAEPSFEQLYTELEATIEQLEAGNLSLDDALRLYERGMELARQCSQMLDRAELRIQELAPAVSPNEALEQELELMEDEDEE